MQVLEVDLDRERISLSLKATQQDPWQEFASSHRVGELVYGRVTKLVPFGAFVQVGDGIEGLVHISEMSAHHVDLPEQVVTPGEELWVKIIDLDLQRRRISLSIKQAAEGGVVAAEYQEHFGEHAYDDEGNYIGWRVAPRPRRPGPSTTPSTRRRPAEGAPARRRRGRAEADAEAAAEAAGRGGRAEADAEAGRRRGRRRGRAERLNRRRVSGAPAPPPSRRAAIAWSRRVGRAEPLRASTATSLSSRRVGSSADRAACRRGPSASRTRSSPRSRGRTTDRARNEVG